MASADNARPPLRLAIDFTPLRSGGENGGVKPFIFSYLGWLGAQTIAPLQFIFITRRGSHADVRVLARPQDELVCLVDDDPTVPLRTEPQHAHEILLRDPPADALLSLRADVLYSPFSSCRCHIPGVPLIATVVDVLHRDYPPTLTPDDIVLRESMFRTIVERATLVQVISRYTLERMNHHYGFPRERMFCSYIAIQQRLQTSAAPAPSAAPHFLYPANAWRHKNHETLLVAYRLYRDENPAAPWPLVLTGHDDPAMRAVLARAAELGLADHVRYLGFVCDEDYVRVWQSAGALVFPSLHEGFGIPLLEGMAFGLPIICGNLTSLPEVGGNACLYVDPNQPRALANAMVRITADPELRAQLRQRGAARLREFSFIRDAEFFLEKIQACAGR